MESCNMLMFGNSEYCNTVCFPLFVDKFDLSQPTKYTQKMFLRAIGKLNS